MPTPPTSSPGPRPPPPPGKPTATRSAPSIDLASEKVRRTRLEEALAASEARLDAHQPPNPFVLGQTELGATIVGIGVLRAAPTKIDRGTNGYFKTPTSGVVRFECLVDRTAGTFEIENRDIVGPATYPTT